MRKGYLLILLIAILVIGTFFRLYHINDESLWLDEGITYYNSTAEDLGGVWDKTAELDQSPPFYYFVMHGYLEGFDENEFGFRLIPLIFGILTILFLYLLVSAMFEEEVGLYAAGLLAILPFHIGFSIESRMYGLLALEAVMAFYFLYKAMVTEKRGYGWWVFFILTSVIGLYTHNFFMFVLLALGFVYLLLVVESENRFGKFLMGFLSFLLIVFAYLPWLPNFLNQLKVDRYWMAENSLSEMKDYFLDFASGNEYVLIGFLSLSAVGIFWSFFRFRSLDYRKGVFGMWAMLLFLIVSLGAPLIYSLIFDPILKIRYVIYLVPIFIGLTGVGIYALRRFSIVFPILIFGVCAYLLVPWQASAYPVEIQEDYRGLVEKVLEKPAPIVPHSPSIAHVINFYGGERLDVYPFPYSDDLREYNIDETFKEKFLDLVKEYAAFYLVVTHTHENPPGLLYIWSDEKCENGYKIDVSGMELYYFEECN